MRDFFVKLVKTGDVGLSEPAKQEILKMVGDALAALMHGAESVTCGITPNRRYVSSSSNTVRSSRALCISQATTKTT